MKRLCMLAGMLAVLLLAACEQRAAQKPLPYSTAPAASEVSLYRLAVHPLYNPAKLSAAYQPLVEHLNRQMENVHFELEASLDYASFEKKYRARGPALLLPNPWQTLQAMQAGYHVIAMAGDAQDFKGIFIARRDSGIKTPANLKGKVVCYPAPTALAAAIMPQYFLHTHGIDVNKDIQNVYVGSQESSIMNVYLGRAAAGATWPPPWRLFQKENPREAAQLMLLWETPSLINNSVMARDDVPQAVRESVTRALLALTQTPAGRAVLLGMETGRFHAANDASYALVAAYIERFEKQVRKVDTP